MSKKVTLNILTRTYRRPNSFAVCRKSITDQVYNPRLTPVIVNHIVGCQEKCEYYPEAMLFKPRKEEVRSHNLYMHDLAEAVKEGWVMYLDDDDMFKENTAVEQIIHSINHEDQLLLWRVSIGRIIVPNNQHFGVDIVKGHISGIGFAFHSKHLPAPWKARLAGDYYVIKHFAERLEIKWINRIFTGTQGDKNNKGGIPEIDKKQ